MFLLDTNAMSNQFARRPNPGVVQWLRGVDDEALFTSVLVIGEMRRGMAKDGNSARTREIGRWLDRRVLPDWGTRVLPITVQIAERWGALTGQAMAAGVVPPMVDALIAATALEHGLHVVTRNQRDFERCGVTVVNPWID